MPSRTNAASQWNRRIHYYLGLYFLFFLWLFSFTGLLLNHGEWKFAEFWPQRKVRKSEQPIRVLDQGTQLERARDTMAQLGIAGEIEWQGRSFRVARPGVNWLVTVIEDPPRAMIEETRVNGWGILRVLHTFTGRNQRNWWLTTLWVLAMDALAVGLILMVLSGIWAWWERPQKRVWGAVALAAGIVVCAYFAVVIRW